MGRKLKVGDKFKFKVIYASYRCELSENVYTVISICDTTTKMRIQWVYRNMLPTTDITWPDSNNVYIIDQLSPNRNIKKFTL